MGRNLQIREVPPEQTIIVCSLPVCTKDSILFDVIKNLTDTKYTESAGHHFHLRVIAVTVYWYFENWSIVSFLEKSSTWTEHLAVLRLYNLVQNIISLACVQEIYPHGKNYSGLQQKQKNVFMIFSRHSVMPWECRSISRG